MNRMHPQTLLFILLGTVPLVVAGAGLTAFLLMRSGYSVLIWAVLPFAASLVMVAALALLLSRAAGSRRRREESGSSEGRRSRRDGV